MQGILRDIRYGFRSLVRSPGLTLIATIALTFGIGLTTAAFSIVYGAIMKGLPFPDGERIVEVYRNNPSQNARRMGVPIADYADYRAQQKTLDALAAYYTGTVNVSGTGDAERYAGAWVTASTFDVASARPLLGRVFRPDETGDVIRMIVRQGALQLAVGLVLGLGLAAAVEQFMRVILFEVQPRDPSIFGGVVLVLAAAGLLACLIPARRAALVDPLAALRSE